MPLSPVILQKGGILPAPLRSRNLLALVLGTVCVEPRVRSQLVGHQFSRTPSALRGSVLPQSGASVAGTSVL